jgi:hypothetical protein
MTAFPVVVVREPTAGAQSTQMIDIHSSGSPHTEDRSKHLCTYIQGTGITIASGGHRTRPTDLLEDLENWVEGRSGLHIAQRFANSTQYC